MSTQQSEACCTVAPVQAKDYKEKGKYVEVNGLNCYTTGPSTATSGIVIIFDIFGFSPQALQGADILAHADDSSHQYQVFMPDLFHGKPISKKEYPPQTPEQKKAVGDFFSGIAAPPKNKVVVTELVKELQKGQAKEVKKWGVVGMCWGAKVVSLSSQSDTVFSAAAEVHPAFLDPEDAKGVTIPMCVLASGDEDADTTKAFGESLKGDKHVERYADSVHGWMAARSNLENEGERKEYERGYKKLLEWFHKHL